MCKCCVVKYLPDKKTLFKCCCFNLTYFKIRLLQMIFSICLYFFDMGSDIMILFDLKNTNLEYFYVCLIMVLLPTFYNLLSMSKFFPEDLKGIGCICGNNFSMTVQIILTLLFNILQLNFITVSIKNLNDPKDYGIVYSELRMKESLLESAPQSLFQLFILLKNISIYSYDQIIIYYLSISISICSLVLSLIYNEIAVFTPFEFNYYNFLIILYRLTEVLSRIGLIAVIGNLYNGNYIIWFTLSDFLFTFIVYSNKLFNYSKFKKFCDCSIYKKICRGEVNRFDKDTPRCCLILIVICDLIGRLLFEMIYVTIFVTIRQLLNNIIFYNFFIRLRTCNKTYEDKLLQEKEVNMLTEIKYHFFSRYLNNLLLSIFIIYKLFETTYSNSLFIISISSIVCYVLNIVFFSLILKYTINYTKYQYIFKAIECCKCNCCKKDNIEKNVEIEEKNPDEIII